MRNAILFVCVTCPPLCGQTTDAHKAAERIPFTLTKHNNILVKARINESVVNLMFHTASDAIVLTEAATQRMPNLRFKAVADAKSWGGGGTARVSQGHTVRIGNTTATDAAIFESKLSGRGSDGKFGPDFFGNRPLEIDFDRCELVLHRAMPKLAAEWRSFRIHRQRASLFIDGSVTVDGTRLKNRFLVHTGFGGSVLLDDAFVAQHKLVGRLKTTGTRELRDSYGNVLRTSRVVLPHVTFGTTALSDVPAEVFSGAIGRQKWSVVGGEVLKRFNMILDISSGRLYLKPNKAFGSAWPVPPTPEKTGSAKPDPAVRE